MVRVCRCIVGLVAMVVVVMVVDETYLFVVICFDCCFRSSELPGLSNLPMDLLEVEVLGWLV